MTEATTYQLRNAGGSDAKRIAALAQQLGYPVPVTTVHQRLVLLDPAEHAIGVAARMKEGVIGWVEVCLEETLTSGRRCRVTGLVVDQAARRQGVGRALLGWAERWARTHGCDELYLTTNEQRQEAHAFYERLGWHLRKTSHVFAKGAGPLPALGFPTEEQRMSR
ncbi:MAG TPA: GNAT family N-acetyltransferase [Planctomycetota bacterium]|jgi:GNAT superfamily N-acetyltransferase|nr:GNAT family N-acetyltransferase [Planctomycetota bacterium]